MGLEIHQVVNNRYCVEEFLGEGGMSQVYKVWDQDRAVYLALKLLRGELQEDPVFVRRFQREGEVLARLQHPHIVRFYGLETTRELAFILMDYIEGLTLRKEIFQYQAPYPPERIMGVMEPVCSALYFAHRQGLIHCDVKPANIMRSVNGSVLLADFGIARMTEGAFTSSMAGSGTAAYMAPEQVKGDKPVPQTDIYALGVVLYEMATGGKRPFTGERADLTGRTIERVRWEQVYLPPIPPRQANPDLSGEMEQVILKCLEKNPAARFNHPTELLKALESAVRYAAIPRRTALEPEHTQVTITPGMLRSSAPESPAEAQPAPRYVVPLRPVSGRVSGTGEDYSLLATAKTPALIIYLLDLSASMAQTLGSKRRIDIVKEALMTTLRQMIFRSTKGVLISPRYRIAMFGYSDHVFDLLNGIKTVDQVAKEKDPIPELSLHRTTDTALGFARVEDLLASEMRHLLNCPAPLVCHMTDGEYTGDDPGPVAQRIMQMRVPDGNVLVENIFISDTILSQPISNAREWPGIVPGCTVDSEYAQQLAAMSSPLPKSYHEMMSNAGYHMDPNALMMLPGMTPSLVEMGFVMSAATPVSR